MRLKNFLIFLTVLFSITGCATVDQIANLRSDVNILKSEVWELRKEVANLEEVNQRQRKSLADLTLTIDEIRTQLQVLQGQVDENQHTILKNIEGIEDRIVRLEKSKFESLTSAQKTDLLPTTSSFTETVILLDPEELYSHAYSIYKKGRYPEAREAFLKFLHKFPQTELSDNAQFWIGECYYKEKNYEKAILAYEEVIQKYPQGNKIPDALLKEALCFRAIGDKTSSDIIFQRVIEKYPESPQAEIARKELNKSS